MFGPLLILPEMHKATTTRLLVSTATKPVHQFQSEGFLIQEIAFFLSFGPILYSFIL